MPLDMDNYRRYQREWRRKWRVLHPEKAKADYQRRAEYAKQWRHRNKDKCVKYTQKWRKKNSEKYSVSAGLSNKRCYAKHISARREYARNYRKTAKIIPARLEAMRAWKIREYHSRTNTDPNFRLRNRMRTRIFMALKRVTTSKSIGTELLIGCSINQLREHLESLFKPGMTWANHGKRGWHIDHKLPCNSFDLRDVNEQKKCFHYTNLQPLWWNENLSKGDKLILA